MKILVDQGFPASIQESRLLDLELWRWVAEGISDRDLVATAAADGFQAVIFLGRASLIGQGIDEAARTGGVTVFGTKETDPVDAALAVSNNLSGLMRHASPGHRFVIYAREIRPLAE